MQRKSWLISRASSFPDGHSRPLDEQPSIHRDATSQENSDRSKWLSGTEARARVRYKVLQEDSLAVMQLDCQMVIFMKNKSQQEDQGMDWSVTSQFLTVGNHWRETKEKKSEELGPAGSCDSV